MLATLRDTIRGFREVVPVPSEAAYRRERAALEEDALAFVHSVGEGVRWLDVELSFGFEQGAEVALPSGRGLRVRGRIDRVDDLDDGSLAIVDYKTGRPWRYDATPFNGARRLQHVLYAAVAARHYGRSVTRAEYRFPTARARNTVASYGSEDLAPGLALIDALLDLVAQGSFPPTDDPKTDCRWCEYGPVCRVAHDGFGRVTAAPALLLAGGTDAPALAVLRQLREDHA